MHLISALPTPREGPELPQFSSSVLRKQGYCFLPFGQVWAQEPETCPGGQKGTAVEPSPWDPFPLTHLEERGTLKAQYLITVFPDFLQFERASCQADGCESGDINVTEKEGNSPGTQAKAAAGGPAHLSASVGDVASAGLRRGGACPGRPGCVLSASLKSARSLRALCGQRVGGAMGTWVLSWGAGGGAWLPGVTSSSEPALPLALWASVSSSVKRGDKMQRWPVVCISHEPLRGQTAALRFWRLGQSQSLRHQPLERTKAAPRPATGQRPPPWNCLGLSR